MDDKFVFHALKVLNFYHFSFASEATNAQVTFAETPQMKLIIFQTQTMISITILNTKTKCKMVY